MGGGPTLEEYVESVLAKEAKTKEAAGIAAPMGENCKPDTSKGQVISADPAEEFQKGESVTGKKDQKKSAPQKKEAAGKAKAEGSSGAGIEISLDADKEFQKGESVDGSKVTPKNKKVKAAASGWVKISNLNDKQKGMLKKYWNVLYPREYVDAMVQDR